jgi:Ca-activated chloride channel homolog
MQLAAGRRRALAAGAAVIAFGCLVASHAVAQFRSQVELVQVAVTVTDRDGRLVTTLGRDDFAVSEDNLPQTVALLSRERLPVSLGILVDISDSMYGKRIEDARMALDRFVLDLLSPSDEAFLMVFNHVPRLLASWTYPPSGLSHQLDKVKPFGGTAIYDAVVTALPLLSTRSHPRCGMLIVSDGQDSASDHTLYDAVRELVPTDAFVYAIAIDEPSGPAIARRFAPQALNDLTGPTGGYAEVISVSADLARATERIADELNHQYMLAYVPSHPADGKYHSIRVRVKSGSYMVRARRGYVDVPTKWGR